MTDAFGVGTRRFHFRVFSDEFSATERIVGGRNSASSKSARLASYRRATIRRAAENSRAADDASVQFVRHGANYGLRLALSIEVSREMRIVKYQWTVLSPRVQFYSVYDSLSQSGRLSSVGVNSFFVRVKSFWAAVCKTVCPFCLSVTLVYYGQTVGWIRMPLGTEVGFGSGHIVLGRDRAPKKGAQPAISGPCLLWPNGWMNQDATCYRGRPWPKNIVLDGDPAPSPKGAQQPSPTFRPMSIVTNGWMDQDATWYGGRPRPGPHCVRWGPSSPLPKALGQSPHFSAHVYCGQTVADLSNC